MPSRSYDARIAFCDVGLLLPFDDLLLLDVKYILIRNKKKRAKYHTSMEANNTARTTGTNHQNEKDIACSLRIERRYCVNMRMRSSQLARYAWACACAQ